jgi:hypothetical protein
MNVSIHARGQLLGRMPASEAVAIINELEVAKAPEGKEARIVRRFGEQRSDGQSNGEVLVAIIERGTVVTCYWRRGTQTFTAEQFRVSRLRDMTRTASEQAAMDKVAAERNVNRLAKAWGAHRG